MAPSVATVFRRSTGVVGRDFMGELILVPLAGRTANLTSIFAANDVGAFIWKLLDGTKDGQAIVEAVVQEYEASPAQALADYLVFLEELQQVGAVEPVGGAP
jgi:hypothetical protein